MANYMQSLCGGGGCGCQQAENSSNRRFVARCVLVRGPFFNLVGDSKRHQQECDSCGTEKWSGGRAIGSTPTSQQRPQSWHQLDEHPIRQDWPAKARSLASRGATIADGAK
jgi:hypothetical protein